MLAIYKTLIMAGALVMTVLLGCATGPQKSHTVASETQNKGHNKVTMVAYRNPESGKVVAEDGRVLVCRKETPIGSNLPRKVCRLEIDSQAEIVQEQEAVRTWMRQSTQHTRY